MIKQTVELLVRHSLSLTLLLLVFAGVSHAGMEKSRSEPYRLQVGDVVEISIYGEDGTHRVAAVDQNGNITYLLVGAVPAVGSSIDEFRSELNERLRENFRFALVSVIPVRFGGQHFSIAGEVPNPGKKMLIGTTSLLDAIAQGGGFRQGQFRYGQVDMQDLDRAFVARGADYLAVDFNKLVTEGDMTQNVSIQDGDYIYIPNGLNRGVHVLGEVILPSNIGYHNGETLVSAIAKARGLTIRSGNWLTIIRGSLSSPQRLDVNFADVVTGQSADIALKPGDIVYAPPRWLVDFEEILTAGVRSFVSSVMNVAGERLVEVWHPDAGEDDRRDIFFP